MRYAFILLLGLWFEACVLWAAPAERLQPVRVCEVFRDLNHWRGKTVAIVGRFSYRTKGRFLSEEGCALQPAAGGFVWPAVLAVVADSKRGPATPSTLDVDPDAAEEKLRHLRGTTPLGHFRFGSLEYDRWAIVYGRVETAQGFDTLPNDLKLRRTDRQKALEVAPLRLVIRGEGLIFFVSEE